MINLKKKPFANLTKKEVVPVIKASINLSKHEFNVLPVGNYWNK
jgi:hypothetical protein